MRHEARDTRFYKLFAAFALGLAVMALAFQPAPAKAQSAQQGGETKSARELAGMMAQTCPGSWKSGACLKNISESVLYLAAGYAADLQKSGNSQAIETLKQKCAAATAATSQDVPAYALESALTECVNNIYGIQQDTGVNPDADLYQLAVVSTLCLKNDPKCKGLENQLLQY